MIFCGKTTTQKIPGLSRDNLSGLEKGPAERGHVKNRQKVSRHFSTFFAKGKKTSKIVKKCQKYFSTLFDNFRAAPVFRLLLGVSVRDSLTILPS